jgi:hypothetical protein
LFKRNVFRHGAEYFTREEVTVGWRTVHNEGGSGCRLENCIMRSSITWYISLNTIRMIKPRGISWDAM